MVFISAKRSALGNCLRKAGTTFETPSFLSSGVPISTMLTPPVSAALATAKPANISDRVAGARLLSGLSPLFPRIRTVIADAGHQSRKLARQLLRDEGWELRIVKRKQRAFQITGLTWIVERTFAWLGRNRRLSKDYEYCVQTSEAMIDIAAIRLMINRLTLA